MVYAAAYHPEDKRAVDRLLEETFSPDDVAVSTEPLGLPATPELPGHSAEIVLYQDSQVEVAVSHPALLALADLFYLGWQVEVDGRPNEMVRVNHVLRGVLLPPGEHRALSVPASFPVHRTGDEPGRVVRDDVVASASVVG